MRWIPIALIAALLPGACSEKRAPAVSAETPPNIFVVSIDTLRSDRIGAYGYADARTPRIDQFARESVRYDRAFATAPLTLPSHVTLFTGLMPWEHGVRDNLGFRASTTLETTAEALSALSYATGAAVSSYVLRRETGVAQGFELYDDLVADMHGPTISSMQRDGDASRRLLVDWIEDQQGRPIFGFLHLYEPHYPWPGVEGNSDDPYDADVARADEIFGRFLDDLERLGLYEDSVIVLVSDHGEGLGDHGELEHGIFLYREALQVPLVVRLPGARRGGEVIASPVSLVELHPVLIGLAGSRREGELTLGKAGEPVLAETLYPRLRFGWSELRSVIQGDRHLIEAPAVELYDYVSDPAETRNRADDSRRVVAELRAALEAIPVETRFVEPALESQEQIARLQSLGYLGGGSSPDSSPADLADPKDRIGVIEVFNQGTRALQLGDHQTASRIGRELVAQNPDFLQGWGLISAAARRSGDLAGAIEALRNQMARAPGNAQTAVSLATLHLAAGDSETARTYAEIVEAGSPADGSELLARIAVEQGDLDEADRAVRAAIEHGGPRAEFLSLAAEVAELRQEFSRMLELLDEIAERVERGETRPVEDLHRRRGAALLQLLRRDEAEVAFRREVESFPANRMAWAQLALVLHGQGRVEESRETIWQALESIPTLEMRKTADEVFRIAGDEEGRRLLREQP